jgi:hypothetical protein
MTDPTDSNEPEPGYLGFLWELPDGRKRLEPTNGYFLVGADWNEATWLPPGGVTDD